MSSKEKIIIGFIAAVFMLGIAVSIWALTNQIPAQSNPATPGPEAPIGISRP